MFDVRFMKNPFYIEALRLELRADRRVREYVLGQPVAAAFLA